MGYLSCLFARCVHIGTIENKFLYCQRVNGPSTGLVFTCDGHMNVEKRNSMFTILSANLENCRVHVLLSVAPTSWSSGLDLKVCCAVGHVDPAAPAPSALPSTQRAQNFLRKWCHFLWLALCLAALGGSLGSGTETAGRELLGLGDGAERCLPATSPLVSEAAWPGPVLECISWSWAEHRLLSSLPRAA